MHFLVSRYTIKLLEAPTPLNEVSNGGSYIPKEVIEIKKQTSYNEQLNLLKSKGIIVHNNSLAHAFFERVSYYRFSGYLLPFKNNSQDLPYKNISFEEIGQLYDFDSKLRSILFNAIGEIEIYLRTQFSIYHLQKYGPEGYLNKDNFNKNHNHELFISHIDRCMKDKLNNHTDKNDSANGTAHYPLYVCIEFFTLGTLSYFYRGMKNHDKAFIAKKLYDINYQALDSWLRCLNTLRNQCAHHSRLYYWTFPYIPMMPRNEKYIPTRRLFAQLYMIKLMYPDHQKWDDEVLKPLIKLIKEYKPYISNKHLDFPYRWKSMLTYK